ncbi:MAG: 30S ribosomal protein S8 [Desulfobacterales bacterium]|nr:30S ribosomal protein S8 [Desulfobacterales bacterium]MDD4070796.1 30S ribosomal protein S8 [Desulfobacterales bacterium]MDD4391198.1 30S ribosomal protein S8 [Desulfobacterales bacterium]
MAMSDPIADLLTRIRNAAKAKHASVDIPGSNLKVNLAKVLKNEGYIKNFKFVKDDKQGILRVYLKYDKNNNSAFIGMKRMSKPSRRQYFKSKKIKSVLNGMGIAILSTSAGIITDTEARKTNIGGEILCNVW